MTSGARDSKPEKASRAPRVCCVCGKPWPGFELAEYGWDAHVRNLPDGGFVLDSTCSAACRAKGGIAERMPQL